MKSEKSLQLVSLNGIVFEGPGMIEGIYDWLQKAEEEGERRFFAIIF